jgi:hypothetical protein
MHEHLASLTEPFLAELAEERLFTGVNICMLLKVLFRCEGFPASLAVVELDVEMCYLDMPFKVIFCRVRGFAALV